MRTEEYKALSVPRDPLQAARYRTEHSLRDKVYAPGWQVEMVNVTYSNGARQTYARAVAVDAAGRIVAQGPPRRAWWRASDDAVAGGS